MFPLSWSWWLHCSKVDQNTCFFPNFQQIAAFQKTKFSITPFDQLFFSQIFREAHIVCVKKGRWLFWNNHQLPLNDSCKVSIITIKLTILYHYISNTWELSKCCILSLKKANMFKNKKNTYIFNSFTFPFTFLNIEFLNAKLYTLNYLFTFSSKQINL